MKRRQVESLLTQLRLEAWLAVLIAVPVLLSLGVGLYVIKPRLQHYRDLNGDGGQETLAEIEDSSVANQETIALLLNNIDLQRADLYGSSPELDRKQLESFVISRLDRLAGAHGIRLVSVRPGDVGQVLMFDEFPYDVSVSGDYFALVRWLGEVESELRPMNVKQFQLSRGPEADVSMRVRLVSYRPREEAA